VSVPLTIVDSVLTAEEPTMTICIANASWVISWDGTIARQRYLRNVDVAFDEDQIVFIGERYGGECSERIDGRRLLLMPGLINLHTHPWSEALNKGFADDFGNPALGFMAMYDMMPGWVESKKSSTVSATVAYSEMLKSGVTTTVDSSPPYDGWIDLVAKSGIRCFFGPCMSSAVWNRSGTDSFGYDWHADDGASRFDVALSIIDEACCHNSGRLSGVVFPEQVDTCTAAFLRKSADAAATRSLPTQIHAAQSVPEYLEMQRRHGCSPIAWMDDIGFLGPRLTVSHGIFVNDHSWINHAGNDVERLARAGTSVAHCPTVFARTAAALEGFARYRAAGINIGIGTDTFPHNMLEEMRLAMYLARVDARSIEGTTTSDIFEAATVGGANALGRLDLGRLAVGAKPDIVVVDLDEPLMQPTRDPLRSLLSTASDRAVRDVIIGGAFVVRNRKVMTLDYAGALGELNSLAQSNENMIPKIDVLHRTGLMLAPLSL
jgi:5-methylthioadenosine/S-adenosylhomocysteine deaminase